MNQIQDIAPSDVSEQDADSDLEELQGDIAKLDASVRDFLAAHRGNASTDASQGTTREGPRGRNARGPRKAAKPRGDITARIAKVNQAFLAGDYPLALDLASEVVRINAETHQAWTALSSIFAEMGDDSKALSAMVYAAHLRPKEVSAWLRCASFALDTEHVDEQGNLHTARLCYSAALKADPTNIEARLGKATICHRQGHLAAAITDYRYVLKRQPGNLDVVRKLAEACIDNKHSDTAVDNAIKAYRAYFELQASSIPEVSDDQWNNVAIYVELFAAGGRYSEAIYELKRLCRWILGRSSETYWDEWQTDDCEWDLEDDRRALVPSFHRYDADQSLYGASMPIDLRARLAMYRLRTADEPEAFRHLAWLDPTDHSTREFIADFPFLAYDVACELARSHFAAAAARYLEALRELPGEPDATILVQLGRCYIDSGEQATAEDCFLAAIEADQDSIEARIELANMYERAREDEEALILAAEALALQDIHGQSTGYSSRRRVQAVHREPRRRAPRRQDEGGAKKAPRPRSVLPRRYRPRRFGAPAEQQRAEAERALKLHHQFQEVQELKSRIQSGEEELVQDWMNSCKELIDDFRSLKKFYTWDKYLHFLGKQRTTIREPGQDQADSRLSQMYDRLSRAVAPQPDESTQIRDGLVSSGHQGISFNEWLQLFLDYAINLAIDYRRDEAYSVCQAARDSNVFQSPEHHFTIHVAWSVCAIYTNDEEKCIATARHLVRDSAMSDSIRMFALLSTLCQSPISWYTSGPAQKYILRQIRAMDTNIMSSGRQNETTSDELGLDVCIIMLYGHILFTSTSFTYALSYFLRARSIDPGNPMISLSLGLAYVHYALKRQSANRQYLILQGQAFMSQYMSARLEQSSCTSQAEVHYNIGRLYHLLGVTSLAMRYYSQAQALSQSEDDGRDIWLMSLTNQAISHLHLGNGKAALSMMKAGLRL